MPFIAAVERDEDGHPQHVRFDLIADLKATSVVDWARQALEPTVQLVTDGLASLGAAAAVVATYGAIIVTPRQSSNLEPFRWVNTFFANGKTAIRGIYHHFKFNKYTRRYLGEAQYIASTAASTCTPSSAACCTPVPALRLARNIGCALAWRGLPEARPSYGANHLL